MIQIHSCRSSSTFPRKLHFHLPQINRMESLRILESGSQHTLVRHHLARWTSLFLCHFYHECRQCHNLLDCPTGTESSQFNVKKIQFLWKLFVIWCSSLFLLRPTLVLEVVLSCRLVLNLRSAAGEVSASKAKPGGGLPWSNNSKTKMYTNPSSSIIAGDQSRSTDLQGTSTPGGVMKLEPNRARPESTWNALTLYTNK